MGNMRNLKELMKDDDGTGIVSTVVCDGMLLGCHALNCIGSLEQSACIALATLMTNVWTFHMADGVKLNTIVVDSLSSIFGK